MRKLLGCTLAVGLLFLLAPAQADAQNRMMNPDCNIICAPVFVLQPGVLITNFIDKPTGTDTNTDFLLRFTTAFGTEFNPLFFAFLIQWTPVADQALPGTGKANTPTLVYGPGFHVLGGGGSFVDMGSAANIFSLDLLPLGIYNPSADPANEPSDFTHKLALEADFFFHFGKLVDPNNKAPYLHGSNIYVILDYLTDVFGNSRPATGPGSDASRWVLLVGATLPFAPIPGGS